MNITFIVMTPKMEWWRNTLAKKKLLICVVVANIRFY
jgi:hypothetical protein